MSLFDIRRTKPSHHRVIFDGITRNAQGVLVHQDITLDIPSALKLWSQQQEDGVREYRISPINEVVTTTTVREYPLICPSNERLKVKEMSSITINDVEYIPASEAGPRPETSKQIVILQRGWVAIGDLSKNGEEFTLNNAQIIQRWGTTKGLGQLALEGPQRETKLMPAGTMRFHELTVIARMDVDASKW